VIILATKQPQTARYGVFYGKPMGLYMPYLRILRKRLKKGVFMKNDKCPICNESILDGYCPECDVPVDEYGQEITDKLIYKPEDKDGKS